MDFIAVPFGYLMSFLYDLTNNYGVALPANAPGSGHSEKV